MFELPKAERRLHNGKKNKRRMDIKTVSHMLGHTDAGFTMNTYMHVTDSMQKNVANTMGNLLGGNAANS